MKNRIRKGDAWLITLIVLLVMYAIDRLSAHPSDGVAVAIVTAVAGSTGIFHVAQVGDNWQRSKHYVPELDPSSRQETEH